MHPAGRPHLRLREGGKPRRTEYVSQGARRTLVCTRGLFFFFDHVAPNPHTLLPPKNLVGWPAFTVQGVVKSEFVDAMDAQASLLRFRPRGQNDGSERSEGDGTPQVGLTSGSEGMREAQAYGIRF